MRRFLASPEARTLTDLHSFHFVMDLAADYFGATIATLGASARREIVFEIIPRKVSIDASAASQIIEENRAFYAFLKREHGLKQADACLRVLGGDAVKRLEVALSTPSNFGMAKALLMGGREAGFDMESKEGIEAWMRAMQAQPLPASFRLPSTGAGPRPVGATAARAKKHARSAAGRTRKQKR